MSDILTGTNLASAILAGLVKRSTTGRGCVVATSQTQALLWLQSQGVGVAANIGERLERFDPDSTSNPLFTVYETSDGWIAIAALSPPQWPALADAVGAQHLLDDPRFATLGAVLKNRDAFRPLLAAHMTEHTTKHWWEAIRGSGVWVSPVNRLEDLANDEHVLANEYLVTFDDGFIATPAPFDVDDWRGARGLAAEYSEHTDQILEELGYDDASILELRSQGAVW